MRLKCIIVEDEPYAQKLLADYISKTIFLELIAAFVNPLEALAFIRKSKVDVIFLDIELPDLNGIEFLNVLNEKVHIIFTTAYSNYAVESYNKGAIDYLLKPITLDRFLVAIDKIPIPPLNPNIQEPLSIFDNKLYIKSDRSYVSLNIDDILYIEGRKDYVNIQIVNKKYIVLNTLKKLEQTLPSHFLRIHNSYIVNFDKIIEFKENQVYMEGVKIPVGRAYHDELLFRINRKLI
jgi:two-component system, LytTR family, response regulator